MYRPKKFYRNKSMAKQKFLTHELYFKWQKEKPSFVDGFSL